MPNHSFLEGIWAIPHDLDRRKRYRRVGNGHGRYERYKGQEIHCFHRDAGDIRFSKLLEEVQKSNNSEYDLDYQGIRGSIGIHTGRYIAYQTRHVGKVRSV
jgi:hypothetical protein